jgi:MoaA/NifB/PqqE/SkfB family radical SAM enzyme
MLKDTFCSSPWFHTRLTYNGDFQECRWIKQSSDAAINVRDTSIIEFYNSERMQQLRTDFLNGKSPVGCSNCYYQDQFGKLSGRRRQLIKSGISDQFDLQMRSSPHYEHFLHSANNNGHSNYYPTDLQIDLGNFCNSACIMCDPVASSRLAQDYRKLSKIDSVTFGEPKPYYSWPRDALVKVADELTKIPNLRYIHFLGGETLFDSAFYVICKHLIDSGRSQDIIIGTTTNGTIYDEQVEQLIHKFKEFHLGISIESVSNLNDYVRYPGKINQILSNIDKFLALREQSGLYVSLRITPNIFTAYELDQLFEYMINHRVIAESCDILSDPSCLRIELMPDDIRQEIINKIGSVIERYRLVKSGHVNIRKTNLIDQVVADTIIDYYNFMKTYTVPDNADADRQQLVRFLKGFEQLRNNSILDYAPRYTDFLRHYGY